MRTASVPHSSVFVKSFLELADIIVIKRIDVEAHHSNDRVVVICSRGHCDPRGFVARVDIAEDSTNRGGSNAMAEFHPELPGATGSLRASNHELPQKRALAPVHHRRAQNGNVYIRNVKGAPGPELPLSRRKSWENSCRSYRMALVRVDGISARANWAIARVSTASASTSSGAYAFAGTTARRSTSKSSTTTDG
jgi:hypothetical protein